jgi:beta-xylosidase
MEASTINNWVSSPIAISGPSAQPAAFLFCLGRETFLFPVTWEDGWPIFNGGQPISEHIEGVLKDKSPLSTYLNDFVSHTLDLSFYFLRTPYKTFHSLTARPGFLRVNANAFALGDRDNPALLLRKQTSYEETFETKLDFSPRSNLTEAGVTIFYSDLLHNDIGIVGDGSGGRQLVTRTNVQAVQVGPWSLTYTNSTITTVKDTLINLKSRRLICIYIGEPYSAD